MTTPIWTAASLYKWVGSATGVWTDASNWQYDGQPATHAPDTNTSTGGNDLAGNPVSGSATITIPAGVTVTIPADAENLGYINLDVQGTVNIPSSDSQLTFSSMTVENGGQANISRTLNINSGLQINNGGTATFEGVTQDWSTPPLTLPCCRGARLILISPTL